LQFHLISFEGPDAYARAGGIASRVGGLAHALSAAQHETHLWFVGDPDLPGHEHWSEHLHVHRWCQWISRHHSGGVYDGEEAKERDFSHSLPPFLYEHHLAPELAAGREVAVLTEEWHTAHSALHLDWILRRANARHRVRLLWNANNVFGFDRLDFSKLKAAATLTTVSRYMRQRMWPLGCDPLVIPNGLGDDAYPAVPSTQLRAFAKRVPGRLVLAKIARWDPDKHWLSAIESVAALRARGLRPLLLARGGAESHGTDVWQRAHSLGLRIEERSIGAEGACGLLDVLEDAEHLDVLVIGSHIDPDARRLLLRAADAVLANSGHEPFGLVGLETMAVGGVACTGCTGEDYATPGQNALVLQRDDPDEFLRLFEHLRATPGAERALRRNARRTALDYSWDRIVDRVLLPLVGATPSGMHDPTRTQLSVGPEDDTRGRTDKSALSSIAAVRERDSNSRLYPAARAS